MKGFALAAAILRDNSLSDFSSFNAARDLLRPHAHWKHLQGLPRPAMHGAGPLSDARIPSY
jgi:hypothetical protein